MSLTTRYLEAFHAVCEAGTLRRAAERLFISQPAISYQIRKLESDLGTPLFERVGRRLLLTAEGRRLRDFCGRYFAELSVLDAELQGRAPTRSEPLRLAAVSVFGRSVLFPLLCGPRFAHLKLELRYRTATEVFEMVERGECDVGATYLGKVSSSLKLEPVYIEELALIVPPAGPTADAVQELEAFESLPLITYDESDYVFGAWFQKVYRAQPAATSSVHHFEELEEVVEMVALGRGSSVVPLGRT